jgi:small subunit ribosomal protein S20
MPNKDSAKKELRKSKSRAFDNKKVKDTLKSLTKKSLKAISAKSDDAKTLLDKTMKAIDKAAKKGVIKKNTRDRKKSRLHTRFNQSQKES